VADQDYLRALAAQDATDAGFPPNVFVAQIQQESGFNPHAYNSASGASGIAQWDPAPAGVDPWNPEQALKAAADWMGELLRQFGSVDLALAAYDAGPGAVQQYGGVPPFDETQRYVRNILAAAGQPGAVATAPTGGAPVGELPEWLVPAGLAIAALWLADVL
jgi:soluble lytic murein transglycosylase-like protein